MPAAILAVSETDHRTKIQHIFRRAINSICKVCRHYQEVVPTTISDPTHGDSTCWLLISFFLTSVIPANLCMASFLALQSLHPPCKCNKTEGTDCHFVQFEV